MKPEGQKMIPEKQAILDVLDIEERVRGKRPDEAKPDLDPDFLLRMSILLGRNQRYARHRRHQSYVRAGRRGALPDEHSHAGVPLHLRWR